MAMYMDTSDCVSEGQLANEKCLKLSSVRHFVIDECDKVLDNVGKFFLPMAVTVSRAKESYCCTYVFLVNPLLL